MRALVAAAFACVALTVPPVTAAHANAEGPGHCPAPLPTVDYDAERMAVSFSVEASGCPTREESRFPLSIRIARTDDAGIDEVARTRWCGPFRPAEDGTTYSCDIELAMAHEPEESAGYGIEIAWPGPDGKETSAFELGCVSQPEEAGCEPTHPEADH